jgi:hypothetical protein
LSVTGYFPVDARYPPCPRLWVSLAPVNAINGPREPSIFRFTPDDADALAGELTSDKPVIR